MTDVITDYELDRECREIAAEIFADMLKNMARDETPEDYRDDMYDRAHEDADGHRWVIYTHSALLICAHCNTDMGEELIDDIGPPKPFTLAGAASLIAYGEMRGRIGAELSDLCDNWEDNRPDEVTD